MANGSSFYHVFLSFRGETRDTFTSLLHEALKARGFAAFMDKTAIRVGDEVDSRIKEGIKISMSAIIVFSKNYAFSTWCLDELLLILERKKISRYFIIPIFYGVEPAEIRHQLGNYGEALEKHKVRHNDKVEKWRAALNEVGNILGEHFLGEQTIFIENIVKLFGEKLCAEFPECRLPMPIVQHNPSPSRVDKIILYFTTEEDKYGMDPTGMIRTVLKQHRIVFEEKNCTKEPKFIEELEELVGKEEVKFPTLIVNGKDFCGEEPVDGLEDFPAKHKLRAVLHSLQVSRKQVDNLQNMFQRTSLIQSRILNGSGGINNRNNHFLDAFRR